MVSKIPGQVCAATHEPLPKMYPLGLGVGRNPCGRNPSRSRNIGTRVKEKVSQCNFI